MADDHEVPLRSIHVYFDERMVEHDTGAGFFEQLPSPLLEVVEKHPGACSSRSVLLLAECSHESAGAENGDRLRNIRSVLQKGPIGKPRELR